MLFPLKVAIDKQGHLVIPKEIREKYSLPEDGLLELVAKEESVEAHGKLFLRKGAAFRCENKMQKQKA